MHKNCTGSREPNPGTNGGEAHEVLLEMPLSFGSFWRRESPFPSGICPLRCCPHPSKWSYVHAQMASGFNGQKKEEKRVHGVQTTNSRRDRI